MRQKKPEAAHWQVEGHLLGELVHVHQALMNLFTREVGISPAQLKFYHEFLHHDQEDIGLTDLALRLGVTPALVTRQVKELEKEGLIQRRPDGHDGRRSYLHLTAKGRVQVLDFHERAHRFEAILIESIPAEDTAAATRVLAILREKLESWRRTGRFLLDTVEPD
jgi:DNA-binding MarR family transcriptional regulator